MRNDPTWGIDPGLGEATVISFPDGVSCSHTCAYHITHPCERCGRIAARGVGIVRFSKGDRDKLLKLVDKKKFAKEFLSEQPVVERKVLYIGGRHDCFLYYCRHHNLDPKKDARFAREEYDIKGLDLREWHIVIGYVNSYDRSWQYDKFRDYLDAMVKAYHEPINFEYED